MRDRQQSTTGYPIPIFMTDSVDHLTGKTGLAPAVTLSKNGAAFAAAAGAVTELGNGWYALAGNATDRATLGPLLLHATAAGADPFDAEYNVVGYDPYAGPFLSGGGARSIAITVTDGGVPIAATLSGALVRVTNGVETYLATTSTFGIASFNVNDGTWQVAITKAGYSFSGASLAVAGDVSTTYAMSVVALTPPTAPQYCTCAIYTELTPEADLFFAQLSGSPHAYAGTTSIDAEKRPFLVVSDHLELQLVRGAPYLITSHKYGLKSSVLTVPNAASCNVIQTLGIT